MDYETFLRMYEATKKYEHPMERVNREPGDLMMIFEDNVPNWFMTLHEARLQFIDHSDSEETSRPK